MAFFKAAGVVVNENPFTLCLYIQIINPNNFNIDSKLKCLPRYLLDLRASNGEDQSSS